MIPSSPGETHDRATVSAALRAAAATWASGEAQAMRRAGFAAWAGKDDDCYARWQIPLQPVHDGTEAYLTIQATDWDGHAWSHWRLAWQLTVVNRNQQREQVRQVEVAPLNAGRMATEDLKDALDSLLCIGPDEVVEWTRDRLAELGLRHQLQDC